MIGKTVSHYRIVGPLGSGGMGVVYSGEDIRLGRPVALKFVPEELAKDRQVIERLNSEARTASGLNHPNICTVYDVGDYEGQPFIVMELLKGQTLRDRLAAGPLRTLDVVELGIQVTDALDAAHRRDIIHRDIKPANLFLVDRGQVKVLDFGLAKLVSRQAAASTTVGFTRERTADGMTLGTVAYMSPEQVTGEELDGRTDLFSLGVVLYEALTGQQPFTGKTSAVVFSAILTHAPVAPVVLNPALPLRLQEIVNNCLEKDRELRYQDAAGLRADLRRMKRDLESGRSGVFRVGVSAELDPRAKLTVTGAPATAPGNALSNPTATASWRKGYVLLAVAVAVVAALVTAAYFRTMSRERTPSEAVASTPSPSFVRTQLALASASIESKDYRAALVYADEVLRVSPDEKDASRIRDIARAMLARFDEAIASGERRLAAGDTEGAASALSTARTIGPAAASTSQLSARIAEQLQATQSTRRDARPPAVAAPPISQRPAPTEPPRPTAGPARTADASASALAAPTTAPITTPSPPLTSSTRESAEPRDVSSAASPDPKPVVQPALAPPAAVALPAAAAAASRTEATERRDSAAGSTGTFENDDALIRRVVATYARAIETKDLALFRSVKPNLSADEQRRIEEGFRAVSSQQVTLSVISLEQHGQQASVRLRRRDTIRAGGRQQTADSLQTMTFTRAASGWVISEIGR